MMNENLNVKKDEELDKWATWHGQTFKNLTDAQSTEYLRRLDLVMATLPKYNTLQKKEKELYDDRKQHRQDTRRSALILGVIAFAVSCYLFVSTNFSGIYFVVLFGFGYIFYYLELTAKETYYSNEISRVELLKEIFDVVVKFALQISLSVANWKSLISTRIIDFYFVKGIILKVFNENSMD
jgi:hypothetical protein